MFPVSIHLRQTGFCKKLRSNYINSFTHTVLRIFLFLGRADGSGDLDRYEIYQLLDSLGRKPTEQQLDNFMATMDPDGSGEVDFNEFSSWWWERHAEARTSTAPAERPVMRATFQSKSSNSG